MSVVLLVVLSLLVLVTAWLLAARHSAERPLEALVAHGIYTLGLICLPLLGLGWSGHLTRLSCALSCSTLCAVVIGLALGRTPRRQLETACRLWLAVVQLPGRALRCVFRSGGSGPLFLLPAAAICLWTLFLSWLAPASGWDGLWYHHSIVGFALQQHGFDWVDVPPRLGMINGYPKTAELLYLWMALFAGRPLLEAPNSLLVPLCIASTCLLLRRVGVRWPIALAISLVFFFAPGVGLQLRSTYIDMPFATVVAASLCFVLREELRSKDLLTAALGLGLVAGMKSSGLLVAGLGLALLVLRQGYALTRLPRHVAGPGKRQRLFVSLCAVLLVGLLGTPYYYRAWRTTGNPFWPAELSIAALDIEFKGAIHFPSRPVNRETLLDLVDLPRPGVQFHDTRDNGYGNALPFWLPLTLLGIFLTLKDLFSRSDRAKRHRAARTLFVGLGLMLTLAASPHWWWARLNLHCLLGALLFAGLGLERLPRWLSELVLAPSLALSLYFLLDAQPGWGVSPQQVKVLLALPATERAAQPLMRRMPTREVALAREQELGAGSTVAIMNPFTLPGPLWNEAYSNRVVFIPWHNHDTFLAELERRGVTWVTVKERSPQHRAVARHWDRVGVINPGHLAYRRPQAPNQRQHP